MNELFGTCLNDNSENKIERQIKNYLDLFINTSLKHMSIRSRLVSQLKNKLISNSELFFYAIDLSPITFVVNLPPNPRGKISTNSSNNLGNTDKNKNSKARTIRIFLNSDTSASIVRKDVLYDRHRILKDKMLNYGKDL